MAILFVILWITAAILLINNPKDNATRWFIAIAFFSGFGGLGVALENYAATLSDLTSKFNIRIIAEFMYTISHQLAPYAILMYGIVYSGLFNKYKHFHKYSPYIFFIPVAIMYYMYPIVPKYKPSFIILSLWAVPYVLFSNILLIYSVVKENNQRVKEQRLFATMIVAPATIFDLVVNYIAKIFDINNLWQYNSITVSIAFVLFLYASLRCGVMGVKLRFERYHLDNSIKAITSGTAMLNHTIKNEILKIGICTNNIKISVNSPVQDIEDINQNINYISESTGFMTEMVKHIQAHTQEIVIVEEFCNIKEIILKSLSMADLLIREKRIMVYNLCTKDVFTKCDNVHMQEVFHNIFKNAVEAMNSGGKLEIRLVEDKSCISITINDTGCGISKENLPHVFAPFFSTKKSYTNFGLGLSYCFNVMQQHGGNLEINSEKNIGTTVSIVFPRAKVVSMSESAYKGSCVNG